MEFNEKQLQSGIIEIVGMGWWVQCPQKEFSRVNTLKITEGDSKGPSRVHECKFSDVVSDIQMYRLVHIYALLHHVFEASPKVVSVGGERQGILSCVGNWLRIEECANEDSRFPSWLKPSRTINCLPKISAPTPGRQATIPAAPPLLHMHALVQNPRADILTRVPVSELSVYEELKNLRLVFGSSGISSLFLNHW